MNSSNTAIKARWRGGLVSLLTLLVVLLGSTTTFAHDPGLSVVEIRLDADQALKAEIGLACSDIDAAVGVDQNDDGRVGAEEVDRVRDPLEAMGRSLLQVSSGGNVIAAKMVEASSDESGGVTLRITFDKFAESQIEVRSTIFERLARGHRQFVRVSDANGRILSENLLDSDDNQLLVPTSGVGVSTIGGVAGKFLLLGVEHILTGYDHVVFLFGLLLVCASFKESAKIITSFTVAHSITLAIAALELVSVPSTVVEPLIAGSIAYVGIENLRRSKMEWRWLLTFAFGLAHGFGFASVLTDLGIGSGAHATVALFSFNAGVEMGQIAIAAVVLPILWQFRRRPIYAARLVPACSVLIALAGAFWVVERLGG